MQSTLEALVLQLLTAINGLSGLAVPEALPRVEFVPHRQLEERACQGRACAVQGWFPPGDTIYLDDRLDPEEDLWARGILLHELVHYVQQEEGRFGAARDCTDFLEREREAYTLQIRWLAQNRAAPVLLRRISWPYLRVVCNDSEQRKSPLPAPHSGFD